MARVGQMACSIVCCYACVAMCHECDNNGMARGMAFSIVAMSHMCIPCAIHASTPACQGLALGLGSGLGLGASVPIRGGSDYSVEVNIYMA